MGVGGTGRGRTAAKMGGERLDPIHSQLELCLKLWGPVGLPEHPTCLGKRKEDGAELDCPLSPPPGTPKMRAGQITQDPLKK